MEWGKKGRRRTKLISLSHPPPLRERERERGVRRLFHRFYVRPSRPLCIDMPTMIFSHFQVFHPVAPSFFRSRGKAASCRKRASRHKLLTFPPPRNSRAILSERREREREKKAGRQEKGEHMAMGVFLMAAAHGEERRGESDKGISHTAAVGGWRQRGLWD